MGEEIIIKPQKRKKYKKKKEKAPLTAQDIYFREALLALMQQKFKMGQGK